MGQDDRQRGNISRRTFLRATDVVAGTGLLGVGTGTATAASDVGSEFRNWRAIEATHVWDRGYRGRTDRTIALTDSGLDARRPDLGPWNGIQAFIKDGQVQLTKSDENSMQRRKTGGTKNCTVGGNGQLPELRSRRW